MSGDAIRQYYGVLGVASDAEVEDIRRAYRQLAGQWHPDANPGDGSAEARFKVIGEAWSVLGDPAARAAFDALLAAIAEAAVPEPGWVDRVFGVRPRDAEPGRNRRYRVSVPVADVIRGTERVVELPRSETCRRCGGARWAASGPPIVCGGCGGRAEVVSRPVVRAAWQVCRRCEGRGWVPAVACEGCRGHGAVRGVERLVVPIPAGTRATETLRVKGKGEPGEPPGDLLVEVAIEPDARFSVHGLDVWHTRVVPFWKALVGGPIEVATAWGPATVQVPPGSRAGDELRLPRWGVARRGEQRVTLEVEWPSELDAAARGALAALGATLPADAFPRSTRADAEAQSSKEGSS